jgi:hypothetical protein
MKPWIHRATKILLDSLQIPYKRRNNQRYYFVFPIWRQSELNMECRWRAALFRQSTTPAFSIVSFYKCQQYILDHFKEHSRVYETFRLSNEMGKGRGSHYQWRRWNSQQKVKVGKACVKKCWNISGKKLREKRQRVTRIEEFLPLLEHHWDEIRVRHKQVQRNSWVINCRVPIWKSEQVRISASPCWYVCLAFGGPTVVQFWSI